MELSKHLEIVFFLFKTKVLKIVLWGKSQVAIYYQYFKIHLYFLESIKSNIHLIFPCIHTCQLYHTT